MTLEELSKTVFDLEVKILNLEKVVTTILQAESRQLEIMNAFMENLAAAAKAKEETNG